MSVSLNKALNTVLRLLPVPSLPWCWGIQDFSWSRWAVLAVVSLGIVWPAYDKGASFCAPQVHPTPWVPPRPPVCNSLKKPLSWAELHLGRNSTQGSSQSISPRRGAFCFFKKIPFIRSRLSPLGLYSAWSRPFASHGQLCVST